jgi:hypothetical protein
MSLKEVPGRRPGTKTKRRVTTQGLPQVWARWNMRQETIYVRRNKSTLYVSIYQVASVV